jgi:hypothetical protein
MTAIVRHVLALVLVLVGCALACSSEPAPASSTTSTSGRASGDDTTTTTSTSEGPADTSTGVVGDGILVCVETCEVPSECCLPGTPCPGPYPYNFDCKGGLCTRAHCEADEDCAAINVGGVCKPVHGTPSCVVPCEDDTPCAALGIHYVCMGTTDEGARVCLEHCDQAGVFCGNQTCDPMSGLCVCTSDGQCQSDWICVD